MAKKEIVRFDGFHVDWTGGSHGLAHAGHPRKLDRSINKHGSWNGPELPGGGAIDRDLAIAYVSKFYFLKKLLVHNNSR